METNTQWNDKCIVEETKDEILRVQWEHWYNIPEFLVHCECSTKGKICCIELFINE